jgi:hypothetical protein
MMVPNMIESGLPSLPSHFAPLHPSIAPTTAAGSKTTVPIAVSWA